VGGQCVICEKGEKGACTVLSRQLAPESRDISIYALRLLLCKLGQVVPVALERVGNLVRRLGVPQLQDRVVVERPVLRLLVLAPDLLAFNAEDFHPDAARGGRVVGHDFGRQRGVAHDYVVGPGFLEHALGQVVGEIVVDDELAHYALGCVRCW
jgi:hypothetical protein